MSESKPEIKDEAGQYFIGLSCRKLNLSQYLIILEQIVAQIQKKLTDAFDVFDGDKTRSVDAK